MSGERVVFKIWEIEVSPLSILTFTTVVTMIGYVVYLLFSIMVFEDENKALPSLSGMIAYSKGTTISFTLLVFVHGYGLMSYLVIASEYIGLQSRQFKVIAACCFGYLLSLILVSYLPLDGSEDPHNIFAVISFVFATLTVYLHKHTFVIDRWPYIDFHVSERCLILSEILLILTITIMGMLFWSFNIMIAEYVFIALLLVDKYIKVTILEKSGLMNIEGAKITYTYYSPKNHPETSNSYDRVTTSTKPRPTLF
jgi:hypothetical protein